MYILDTNVISELRKAKQGKTAPNVLAWAACVPSQQLFLSAITILEIEIGILSIARKDTNQAQVLKRWLEHQIIPTFEHRILDISLPICRRCAALHVPNRQPDRDAFIAATALEHNMTIVTRNTIDFEDKGVQLVNPWNIY